MSAVSMDNRLLDFITNLNAATSVDAAWQLSKALMTDLGATQVGIKLAPNTDRELFLWTMPDWAINLYLDGVYPDHDPRLAHCRKNTTPYVYGREFWQNSDTVPAPRRRYDEEILSIGMRSMVSFPFHTLSDRHAGIFSIATDLRRDEFRRMYAETGPIIQLASVSTCNCIAALARPVSIGDVEITDRERECLLWLGRGCRNDEIAHRLGVRPVTVEFHIANARRKLNARTREQALVRAIQLDLVTP